MSMPKISVISPSFNCARLIRRCIESVQSQRYTHFEHIIVDGASTDGTPEILKEYPHVRWISEPDGGEAEALNKALRMVTGDIINWLNVDDCYVGTRVFEVIADAALEHPDCDVFYGKGVAVNEQGEVLWYRRPLIPFTLRGLMRWTDNLNLMQPAMFYSRRMMDDVGFFREDLRYAIDNDYWLRIAAKGYRAHFVEQVLALATLVREGAKSGAPFEDQHIAWQEVTAPYQFCLSYGERVNFWREYYAFRIRPPVTYEKPLEMPEADAELHGFTVAALEHGHLPLAATAVERLTAISPQSPHSYWLLSEVLHKTGNSEMAIQAMQHGMRLTEELGITK